jgi:chloramphenicol-sensitive protein RarD
MYAYPPPNTEAQHREYGRGLTFGITAYLLWGLFPLYWPLLEPAGALEILAARFAWSLAFLAIVATFTRAWRGVGALFRQPRIRLLLVVAATVLGINWGTYIWGVNAGHVVETSLGYFITPLISLALGVFVLKERLRPLQWVAFGIAFVAVLVLTANYGRPPWIALVLAASFGSYGLIKKVAGAPPLESLIVETTFAFPLAVGYLLYLQLSNVLVFGHVNTSTTLLLAATGVITAIPLLFFGGAVNRVPLTVMGVLQYLAPIIQFLVGIFYFHEDMPPARWAGFVIVWIALMVFTADAIRHNRATRQEDPIILTQVA